MNKIISKIVKIVHIVSAIIFAIVFLVLFLFYGGEFLLVAVNKWLFILFAIVLILNAIFFSLPYKDRLFDKIKIKIKPSKILLMILNLWNILLGFVLIYAYIALIYLTFDMFTGIMSLLYVVIAIPFLGYSFILLCNSTIFMMGVIKFRKYHISFRNGILSVGVIFLLIISIMSVNIISFKPVWTEGIYHYSLFTAGEADREYRIPSMLILPGDIILAFSESREDAFSDWGDIDLVMKKSIDGGDSWGEIVTLVDAGDYTAGNPCPVYDSITDKVVMLYCINNQKVFTMISSDYGDNWSTSIEITDQLDLDIEADSSNVDMIYGTGPGIGIQLNNSGALNGRLVIPSYYLDGRGTHVIYSDDHGLSWSRGENITETSSEPQVFETTDGRLCINARNDAGGYRYVATSDDGGLTFSSAIQDNELPDSGCQGSIIRYNNVDDIILFSNPDKLSRGNMTVRISYNNGDMWEKSLLIYNGPSAYSNLGVLSDGSICLLFEQGKYDYRDSITFVKFPYSMLQTFIL